MTLEYYALYTWYLAGAGLVIGQVLKSVVFCCTPTPLDASLLVAPTYYTTAVSTTIKQSSRELLRILSRLFTHQVPGYVRAGPAKKRINHPKVVSREPLRNWTWNLEALTLTPHTLHAQICFFIKIKTFLYPDSISASNRRKLQNANFSAQISQQNRRSRLRRNLVEA